MPVKEELAAESTPRTSPTTGEPQPETEADQPSLLQRHRWLPYVLPFAVYMLLGTLEPPPPGTEAGWLEALGITYAHYPLIYTLKLLATLAAMAFVLPVYREFRVRITPWSVVVGVIGVAMWIGLCRLNLEAVVLPAIGLGSFVEGTRSAFNPLAEMSSTGWAVAFLAVRFVGLAALVPVIEEFFLRGFVLRYCTNPDRWWRVPFGRWDVYGIGMMTFLAVASHPGELFAALVWFSLVTWLMLKTRSMWDCVVAHAVTNLLLGIYVVWTGTWELM